MRGEADSADEKARREILSLFGSMPPGQLKRLATEIELDPDKTFNGLPRQAVMEIMRPFLAVINAPRAVTPERIFCVPFENLLIDSNAAAPDGEAIRRSSFPPIWRWLTEALAPVAMTNLTGAITDARRAEDAEAVQHLSREMWACAGEALGAALGDPETALPEGAEVWKDDARRMGATLRVARPILDLKHQLPDWPANFLTVDHLNAIHGAYLTALAERPADACQVLIVAARLMLQPFPLLKVFRMQHDGAAPAVPNDADVGRVMEVIVAALEEDADQVIEMGRQPVVPEAEIIRLAMRFSTGYKAVAGDVAMPRDSDWARRLQEKQDAVGAVLGPALSDAVEG